MIFEFSYTVTRGNLPGTVAGSIYGLEDNMSNQAASAVIIESYPDSFPSWAYSELIDGDDAILWDSLRENSFDVTDGQITAYRFSANSTDSINFFALLDSGGVTSGYGAGFNFLSFRQISGDPPVFVAASNERYSIFSQRVQPAPEPGILGLLSFGLLGLAATRRRQLV